MFAMLMGLQSITPQELHASLQTAPPTVIDVNPPRSWLAARVPGALNLGVDFAPASLPADRNMALVFYCSNRLCRKAAGAARRARSLGHTDVRVMSAGITGWRAAGLPTASGN
jgi:rhodanese-related sulfurtransferase